MKVTAFTTSRARATVSRWIHLSLCPLLAVLFGTAAKAEIRLPSILGSNMVLQQKSSVTLWGWCEPAENITIKVGWSPTELRCTGTNGARWSMQIDTPAAGGPYGIEICGSSSVFLKNVLIGEVWLCSGQSNMEWSAQQRLEQAMEEAPRAHHPNLRLFYLPKSTSDFPQDNCSGTWEICAPDAMRRFSAVGYFFGRRLQEELNVPIGLVCSAWGGTPAEVWAPPNVFVRNAALRHVAERLVKYPWRPSNPASCYNAMIHPITQLSMAGVVWYQGESNVDDHDSYQMLFTELVAGWRREWKADFPFYYVQIAPFRYSRKQVGALLREAQTRCTTIANTGMVVVSDLVDDVKNIHPPDKRSVGRRLAARALSETYHRKEFSGRSPVYKSMTVEGGVARIHFDEAQGGLTTKGGNPTCFEIAGTDRIFHPAQAEIDGNTILVHSDSVAEPQAVRFAFDNESLPNLFNKDGLPVNLFRTDDWPVDTSKR